MKKVERKAVVVQARIGEMSGLKTLNYDYLNTGWEIEQVNPMPVAETVGSFPTLIYILKKETNFEDNSKENALCAR